MQSHYENVHVLNHSDSIDSDNIVHLTSICFKVFSANWLTGLLDFNHGNVRLAIRLKL